MFDTEQTGILRVNTIAEVRGRRAPDLQNNNKEVGYVRRRRAETAT